MKRRPGRPSSRFNTALAVLSSEHLPAKFTTPQYISAHLAETGKPISNSGAALHIQVLRASGLVECLSMRSHTDLAVYAEAKTKPKVAKP